MKYTIVVKKQPDQRGVRLGVWVKGDLALDLPLDTEVTDYPYRTDVEVPHQHELRVMLVDTGGRTALDDVLLVHDDKSPPGSVNHEYLEVVGYRHEPSKPKTKDDSSFLRSDSKPKMP